MDSQNIAVSENTSQDSAVQMSTSATGRSGRQSDGLQNTKINDGKIGADALMIKRRDEDTLTDCLSGARLLDCLEEPRRRLTAKEDEQ